MDQWDVVFGCIGGQQRESDRDDIAVGAVPHQPSAGFSHSLPIRAQRRGNDVVIAMDRNVSIAEGVDKLTRPRVRLTEVLVEDGGDIRAVEPLILRTTS
ncbi:hypothetical protein Vlu01_51520 [Micromonospora lutea]|uniref:Uncharacterized protein n=1 Tax=Micromonospora lutea TaxID=419825 RepID=A0ABQ4J3E3_9ACTN|nr:hypothetical protein Vlu01_51520 [Micromonospora lutea]